MNDHDTTSRPSLRSRPLPCFRGLWLALSVLVMVIGSLIPLRANAQINATPPELQHVGVNEHLDQPIPLDTAFRDHTGKAVKLGDFFDNKRPVVLTFAYHTCPVLCGMVLNNLTAGLKGVPWTIGKEFDVVTISVDPKESLEKTAAKRTSMLTEYGRIGTGSEAGWHFLVGDEASIAKVASAAGFEYEYDPNVQGYAHPSVVMITTPDGKMARYLYGIEFPPKDLRLGLLEASQGRSISTVEKLIMYCYHYDPQGGKYVLVAMRVMQVGAVAVALVLFAGLAFFWRRELRLGRVGKRSHHGSNDKNQGPDGSANQSGNDETHADPPVGRGEARVSALGV